MKIYTVILLLFISFAASAQSTESAKDSLYIVTYTTGKLWDVAKPPGEQQFFKEHSGFMGKLRKDGITKFGARYGDKGIIVITALSLDDATALIKTDQAVINNLFLADIQRLNIFFDGCLERPKGN